MDFLNIPALFVAALMPLIVGFVWYNPKVFGNAWMKSLGFTEETVKGGNMPLIFGLSYLLSVISAFFIAITIHLIHVDSGHESSFWFGHGMIHGTLLGLGFIMPVIVTNALFERRSFKLIMINLGYWLLSFALMGGVVEAWK